MGILFLLDGQLKIYDIKMGTISNDQFGESIQKFAISSDKSMIACSCSNGKIYLIEKATGNLLKTYNGHVCSNFSIDL